MTRLYLLHTTGLAGALAGASFIAATPAYAQTPAPVVPGGDACQAPADQRDPNADCPPADSPAGESIAQGEVSSGGEGIVVVGSRIRRDRFNSADAVTVINRDAAVDAGFTTTAEILQSVGVTGGGGQINDTYGGLVVEGGNGVNTLGLRGLGPNRTLILLNGRRLSPAGTRGQVFSSDLNVLPNAIIDRIEVLNTGASSIYGSDAVAGVVNVVTLPKFNGLAVEAAVTAPQIGAGTSQRYAITAGASGERFSILGSLELYDRGRITLGDNPWTRCGQQRRLSPLGADDTNKCFPLEEGGVTVNTIATGYYNEAFYGNGDIAFAPGFEPTPEGFEFLCNRFRPNGAVTGGDLPGFECVSGLFYNPDTGDAYAANVNLRDTFAPSILQADVISPTRNYTGFLTGTFDTGFFGDGQLYGELLVTRRKSNQRYNGQFAIDYPVNSPLIAAGLGVLPRQATNAYSVRAFTNLGLVRPSQVQDYVKASAGFRGDLPFLPTWRYDVYASKSWSDGRYQTPGIAVDRLNQSFDVVENEDGTFSCADPSGGCVAAPPLTAAIIAGDYAGSPWFDYIRSENVGHTSFRETITNLAFDGPLFRLPGGDAQAVVGLEYRKSSINDVPSEDSQRANIYNSSSAPITRGSDSVWEAYGELELPLLRDVPFAETLTVNASGRYTDYKSYGSNATYKVGGIWAPVRWLSFRGSYGTSYRAPALSEQFLGATTGFQSSTIDPCDGFSSSDNPNLVANCQADGLPLGFVQNNGVTVYQQGGAETGLDPETSTNLTFGGVFQSRLGTAANLSIAIDYFDVKIKNGVGQLSLQQITQGCYLGTNPEYCIFVDRAPYTGPSTGALSLTQTYFNIAKARVKGFDFVVRLDAEVGPGRLDVGASATKLTDSIGQTSPDVDPFDFAGEIGVPKWAGTGHIAYKVGSWYARWSTDYLGKMTSERRTVPLGFDPAVYDFSVPSYWLHAASIRFEPNERYSLTMGIRNVFNKRPPRITAEDPYVNTIGNVPLQASYDLRGRTFFVNAQAKIF